MGSTFKQSYIQNGLRMKNLIGNTMWKLVFRHMRTEGPDQPVHPCSLLRAFAVCKQNDWILWNVSIESKCLIKTLHMCRMLWVCTFCTCSKALFCLTWPFIKRFLCYQSKFILTLVMLKRCHSHFQFSANRITWSRLLIQIHILNGKQCRSRQLASS